MTATAIIFACMALLLVIGVKRQRAGRAITDLVVLVFIFGAIAIADLVLGRFVDTGDIGVSAAVAIACAFAFDAVYGLIAPQRQRQRDRRLRAFMQRRRA